MSEQRNRDAIGAALSISQTLALRGFEPGTLVLMGMYLGHALPELARQAYMDVEGQDIEPCDGDCSGDCGEEARSAFRQVREACQVTLDLGPVEAKRRSLERVMAILEEAKKGLYDE